MKKSLRILAVALVAIMLSMLVVACAPSTPATDPSQSTDTSSEPQGGTEPSGDDEPSGDVPIINGVYASLAQDYYHMMEYGAYCAADDLGAQVAINGPSVEGDVTVMISMIEDAITKGCDALLITPWDTELMTQPAKNCYEKGIPLIVLDSELDGEGKQYRSVAIGVESQYAAAQVAGQYILENYPDGGKIAIIRGLAGQESHTDRSNGVADMLTESGKWEVVGIQPADSDRGKGTTVAENFMQAHDDITLFYATNDEMALGAYVAVESANVDIDCIGFDATTDALKSIIDGKLKASVAQKPLMLGYLGVEFALKLLAGEELEGVDETGYYAYTPEMMDATNAQEYLDSIMGEWDRGKALKEGRA